MSKAEAERAEAIVARLRDDRQRRLALLERLAPRPLGFVIAAVVGVFYGLLIEDFKPQFGTVTSWLILTGCVLITCILYPVGVTYFRYILRSAGERQDELLAGKKVLQETLEEDFFTKLVKINFKYIDQYYLQTKEQADKSFALSAIVATIGAGIIISGIVLVYDGRTEAATVAAASGILAEFIAAVFFYLYNQTVLKMGEYHQKLVITQNIGLALKIAEGLPVAERVDVQRELVLRLTDRVNEHLTRFSAAEKPKADA